MEIQHKPTGEMLDEYESKPTQGTLFHRQREELMNFPLDYEEDVDRRRTCQNTLPKNEADIAGRILEMRPERVCVEDNKKALKLASNDRSANVVTQAIIDGGKSL